MGLWDNFKLFLHNSTSRYSSEEKVTTQGLSDMWKFTDAKFVSKVKNIVDAIDEDKIKLILDTIKQGEDGYLEIKINLKVKRNNE